MAFAVAIAINCDENGQWLKKDNEAGRDEAILGLQATMREVLDEMTRLRQAIESGQA